MLGRKTRTRALWVCTVVEKLRVWGGFGVGAAGALAGCCVEAAAGCVGALVGAGGACDGRDEDGPSFTVSWRSCCHGESVASGACFLMLLTLATGVLGIWLMEKAHFAGEYGPPTPPLPPRTPNCRKPFGAGDERWSCMKKAPRFGMKAGSESRFFLYSSCSRRLRSANVSGRPAEGAIDVTASAAWPVSKSTTSASAAWSEMRSPFSIMSVSLDAVKPASDRAMGGEGTRRLATSGRGFGSRGPLALRLALPSVSEAELSTSLRSLLSASASSSASLGTDMSLCESSAGSVATECFSSSSRARRRAWMAVRFLMPAMVAGVRGGRA